MERFSVQTGRYLIQATAVNLIAVALLFQSVLPFSQPQTTVQAAPVVAEQTVELPPIPEIIYGQPQQLYIPRFDLSLTIKPGSYQPDTGWTLNNIDAFYNQNTVPVNDYGGNTHIYGHNIWGVFKSLHQLENGDQLVIKTDTHSYYYNFNTTKQVNPSYDKIYQYRGSPIVTLQTCSGAWNQHRQLFEFTFDRIQKLNGL